jgi:RimJ/RimL family protein N-acetyltransferase
MALDLRPTTEPELDFVLGLEADPDVSPFISPATRELHAEAIADPDQEHLLVTDDGEPVGFALLAGIENPHRSLEVRRIGVVTRGRGVGRRALALVVDHAFERWSPRRVWLDVMDHNERAQRAYEAAGFIREGVLRESLRIDDRYESMVIMSVLMS